MVELLHVDPGVIAALDGADDDAAAAAVEKCERGRLVAARAFVGVVADERRLRERLVDSAVDARETGRDLVDGAMQIVAPRLQRDREVDEVVLATPEHHLLATADVPELGPGRDRDSDCDERSGD